MLHIREKRGSANKEVLEADLVGKVITLWLSFLLIPIASQTTSKFDTCYYLANLVAYFATKIITLARISPAFVLLTVSLLPSAIWVKSQHDLLLSTSEV
jgi:hypothetical protein